MVIPKINSAHGSDTRNILNRAIDLINAQGKSIQDLVADGQLTEEQYAKLIVLIGGYIQSGFLDKSDFSPELFNEFERIAKYEKSFTSQMNEVERGYKNGDADLNTRIDNIIAPTGEAPNIAEIVDARDNHVSLGANIRGIRSVIEGLTNAPTYDLENVIDNSDPNMIVDGNVYIGGTPSSNITKTNGSTEVEATGDHTNVNVRLNFDTRTGKREYLLDFDFIVDNPNCYMVSVITDGPSYHIERTSQDVRDNTFKIGVRKRITKKIDVSNANRISVIFRHHETSDLMSGVQYRISPVIYVDLSKADDDINNWSIEALAGMMRESILTDSSGRHQVSTARNDSVSFAKSFGVVGDGVVDDTAAIQRALDQGGIIFFGPGIHKVSRTMYIKSNTIIHVHSRNTRFVLADDFELDVHTWREGQPDYYPVFVTDTGTENIVMDGVIVEGSNAYKTHIQVGIALEGTKNIKVRNCGAHNINYFPEKASPRPAGQWRRGWNIATFRSTDIEIVDCDISYGAYECLRIGDYTKNVKIHRNKLSYGWRTVFQVLRGCENIQFIDNDVLQDDFGTNDTHAVITFHSAPGEPIKNVLVRDNRINGKMFLDQPSYGNAISCVDNYMHNIIVEGNDITSNGAGMYFHGSGVFKFKDNHLDTGSYQLSVHSNGLEELVVGGNTATAKEGSGFYVQNQSDTILKIVRILDNDITSESTEGLGIVIQGNTGVVNPFIRGNVVRGYDYGLLLQNNVDKYLVTENDFSESQQVHIRNDTGIEANNMMP